MAHSSCSRQMLSARTPEYVEVERCCEVKSSSPGTKLRRATVSCCGAILPSSAALANREHIHDVTVLTFALLQAILPRPQSLCSAPESSEPFDLASFAVRSQPRPPSSRPGVLARLHHAFQKKSKKYSSDYRSNRRAPSAPQSSLNKILRSTRMSMWQLKVQSSAMPQ